MLSRLGHFSEKDHFATVKHSILLIKRQSNKTGSILFRMFLSHPMDRPLARMFIAAGESWRGRSQPASEGKLQVLAERLAPQVGTRGSQNPHNAATPDLLFRSRRLYRTPTDLFTVDNPLHNRQNARCLRSRCPRRQVHPELLVYTLGAAEEFSHKRWKSFSFRASQKAFHRQDTMDSSSNCPAMRRLGDCTVS